MQTIEDLVFSPKIEDPKSGGLNLWVVESIRLSFYFFAVVTSIISQLINPYFLNFNIWLPVYIFVIVGLIFHFAVIFLHQKIKQYKFFDLWVFGADILFITAFNYFTYFSYPLFTVLYIINIILAAFVVGSAHSFFLAGLTTFFYTIVYLARLAGTSIDQISYVLNIMTFYVSAILAGYLGDLLISRSEQLKETRSDLKDLKTLSQIIIKNIGVGLVAYEQDKTISFANQAAHLILGKDLDSADQQIKNNILIHHQENLQQTLRQEIEINLFGLKKHLELVTTFIPDQDLQTRWVLLVQDLTEIKSLQKELALKEKLAAIGQLAGGIAHEIRNPLASISGSVEMLKETTQDSNPENTKLFSIIIKEIDRLNLLITDFLSFVRPEVKRTDDVILKDLIDDILTLIKYDKNLSENVVFELNLSDVKVKCDKAKLKQALLNIITNALQAMKGQSEPKLICQVKSEGYFASLEFTDNGPGMSEDVAQRIFEPFYTTKAKGTGLGLAITHRIIEGHEGLIKVTSIEKKGTTFFIRLPIK